MIIIQKNFTDPHKEVIGFAKEGYERAMQERAPYDALHLGKTHEITRTRAIDPAKKAEMIEADKRHDFQEGMEKGLNELKTNNWKIEIPKGSSKQEAASTSSSEPTTAPKAVSRKPASKPKTTALVSPKTEEVTVPSEETISPEGVIEDKAGMSTGAKIGLGAAGVAAAGAAGYAAYKAWKKRKARKEAVDAEVNEFLNNNYKTSK